MRWLLLWSLGLALMAVSVGTNEGREIYEPATMVVEKVDLGADHRQARTGYNNGRGAAYPDAQIRDGHNAPSPARATLAPAAVQRVVIAAAAPQAAVATGLGLWSGDGRTEQGEGIGLLRFHGLAPWLVAPVADHLPGLGDLPDRAEWLVVEEEAPPPGLLGYYRLFTKGAPQPAERAEVIYASDREHIWSSIQVHFQPQDWVWAYCIAEHESTWNPLARGDSGMSIGVMQPHWPSWRRYIVEELGWPIEEEDLLKVNTNIKVASAILAKGGRHQWTTASSC